VIALALAALLLSGAIYLARRPVQPDAGEAVDYARLARDTKQEVGRGRYSSTYLVEDDLMAVHIAPQPVHYRDPATQEWRRIDLNIRPSHTPGFDLDMVENDYQAWFKTEVAPGEVACADGARGERADAASVTLLRYSARGAEVDFGLDVCQPFGALQPSRAEVDSNRLVYQGLYHGLDLTYRLEATRLVEELVVHDPQVAARITEVRKRVWVRGARLELRPDGALVFVGEAEGKLLFTIPRPVLYERDAPGEADDGVSFQVERTSEGAYLLRKALGASGQRWLRQPERQFPIVDDSIDLNQDDLTTSPDQTPDLGYGDGYVSRESSQLSSCDSLYWTDYYDRQDDQPTNYMGCYTSGGTTSLYYGFFEWNTGDIIGNPNYTANSIRSVGLFLNGIQAYAGQGKQVIFTQLTDRPKDQTPLQLWTAIDTGAEYHRATGGLTAGVNYFNLGCRPVPVDPTNTACTSDLAIRDLEANLGGSNLFYFGMMGSQTLSAGDYGSYTDRNDPAASVDIKPDLVVFYKAAAGAHDIPNRPLRNAIWDGNAHWLFYTTSDSKPIHYVYSTNDGLTWSDPAYFTDSTPNSKHHTVAYWVDGLQTKVALAYHVQGVGGVGAGDLHVSIGTINSTNHTISWAASDLVLDAPDNYGYDFPSIVRDSTGYCWLASRYGPTTSPYQYSQVVIRSSRSTDNCASWDPATAITIHTSPQFTLTRDFLSTGGYVVPLATGGKVYVVFKSRNDEGADTNPLYGRLCDSSGPDGAANCLIPSTIVPPPRPHS